MTGMSTGRIAGIGLALVAAPLVLLLARATQGLVVAPAAREVVLLDIGILAVGSIGITAMLAVHVRSAVSRPVEDITAHLRTIAGGRFEDRVATAGPAEFMALADEANSLAEAMEQRVHDEAQRSGVLAMGTVLVGVAHEVSNPLAQMRVTVATLQERARASQDPQAVEGLERLLRGIQRLADTVTTLRVAGHGPGVHATGRIVHAALIVAQQSLLTSDVVVDERAEQDLDGDASLIIQAIVAVVRNAGEAGGHRIHLRTDDDGAQVAVEVEDEGVGIPAAIQGRAAEPFMTSKPGHTGLGLTHARRIAEEHGGSLRIQAARGGGTCVSLRFPAARRTSSQRHDCMPDGSRRPDRPDRPAGPTPQAPGADRPR